MRVTTGLVLAMLALPVAAGAQPCDERFVLHNNSSQTLVGVWASNSGSDDYGENMISGSRLDPNHYIVVNPWDGSDARYYDLMFQGTSGNKTWEHHVDVCNLQDYRIRDK
jgi:hypothetical protein